LERRYLFVLPIPPDLEPKAGTLTPVEDKEGDLSLLVLESDPEILEEASVSRPRHRPSKDRAGVADGE
jgi:hypothetical protein